MADRLSAWLAPHRWLVAVGTYAGILVATLLPSSALPEGPDILAPIFHVAAFAVLAGVFALGWPRWGAWRVMLVVLALGIADEVLQLLVPGRAADPLDVFWDVCGAVLVIVLLRQPWVRAGLRSS